MRWVVFFIFILINHISVQCGTSSTTPQRFSKP